MKSTEELIKEVGREVVVLLLEKNKAYGDTANQPPKIFSKLSAKEGILARIDDKLSRIKTVGINDHPNTPNTCLLYTSPSPRDRTRSRMPSSA